MSASTDIILAIAPVSRGFGVFVMDSAGKPVEWFVREIHEKKSRKNARCLAEVDKLMEQHRPTVLVLEDHEAQGSKKRKRISELLTVLVEHAIDSGVGVIKYGPRIVRLTLGLPPGASKVKLAEEIGKRHPAIRSRVPKQKRIWEHDAYSTPMFVAAALAETYFQSRAQRKDERRW